jgi:hypothetical protein
MVDNKKSPVFRRGILFVFLVLQDYDLGRLKTFGAVLNRELNLLTFFEGVIPLALDGGMMDEDVHAAFLSQETVTLAVAKPFDGANDTLCH